MHSALTDIFSPPSLFRCHAWNRCALNYIQCSSCGLINSKLEKALNFSLHITYFSPAVKSLLEQFCCGLHSKMISNTLNTDSTSTRLIL